MSIPTKFDRSVGKNKVPASPKQKASSVPSKVGRSIATRPAPQRLNTDKFAGEKFVENTELRVHTCHDGGALPYDQVKESLGYHYSHPPQFESTIDRSDRLTPWNAIEGFGLEDKDVATGNENNNHGKEIGLVEGYHKQPNQINHSMEDMKKISQGGVLDDATMEPAYKQSGWGYYKLTPTSTSVYGSSGGTTSVS
jgi:hypothetical protein